MAALRVLDLPELLEHILAHLDTKTLLLSQRVSKQWQAVIKSSHELQCLLFFRQRPTGQGRVRGSNLLLLWEEDTSGSDALYCGMCGEDHYHSLDSGDLDGTFIDCDRHDGESSALRMFLVSAPRKAPVEYKVRHSRNPDVEYDCIAVKEDLMLRYACQPAWCFDCRHERHYLDDDELGGKRHFVGGRHFNETLPLWATNNDN